MSDFFKNPLSSSSTDSAARKQAIMDQVRNELAQANAQQLMNNMNERCFKACVTKPGDSLSSSEQTCLTRCLDRFMDTFNIVSKTYISRIAKERSESESTPFN
ncbi:Tim10/DDP family zinc finger-domain-containing protein [Lentinula edodes]|uniref:Mitochondrial import inner membrane translocase subunit n=2 Tax=Lentinula TaxID=5352 RepID=A0ABQ8VCG6_9AGAR|nr:Tim10/DDP family zinc finger-domain-containing protein [Lentinula edodes]KAH7873312.1 Tim10/DDP family zinc finger-domain-containing protein [Lentinula edodes]KAJ3905380.1 Tim10/DDP family zinc finger-domain-containing protein [Lentinula edodes]KAJ3926569.1 MAG: Tim10/DDP family zinc finger-domain-containing protein [Lentinula lateritia]KAJ4487441.1 Tim10/DDP family zinc finger-domain-containing protein [Lentinula lateritia]